MSCLIELSCRGNISWYQMATLLSLSPLPRVCYSQPRSLFFSYLLLFAFVLFSWFSWFSLCSSCFSSSSLLPSLSRFLPCLNSALPLPSPLSRFLSLSLPSSLYFPIISLPPFPLVPTPPLSSNLTTSAHLPFLFPSPSLSPFTASFLPPPTPSPSPLPSPFLSSRFSLPLSFPPPLPLLPIPSPSPPFPPLLPSLFSSLL